MSDPASLQNLHDIVSPPPVAWLPPAPGWYAMGLSLLLLLGWFAVQKFVKWKRNRYRREALAELADLENQLADSIVHQKLLPQYSQLVKRTAIAAYGRRVVASVTGDEWLIFLDKTADTRLFTQGSGRLLYDCAYQPVTHLTQLAGKEITELHKAVLYWIRKHKNSPPRGPEKL